MVDQGIRFTMYKTLEPPPPLRFKITGLYNILHEPAIKSSFIQRCPHNRAIIPQINCIKVLLRSIFFGIYIAKLKTLGVSVHLRVSNGARKLTFLHLNQIFV